MIIPIRSSSLQNDPNENVILEVIKNDTLRQWERKRRAEAERTILTAAKLISPSIASTFSDGYTWLVVHIDSRTSIIQNKLFRCP